MLRVGVVGAAGRMGREACRAVHEAPDLDLVAAVNPRRQGATVGSLAGVDSDLAVSGELAALVEARAEVAVDLTRPDAVAGNATWYLEHGIHAVVGTTGLTDDDLGRLADLAAAGGANAVIAPNFAIGAVLLMQLARTAARYLPHVEIVELHHDGKADAPSGTALRTAELIAHERGSVPETPLGEVIAGARGADHAGIRVHSVRLPGLVAHQEVLFGGEGETLSLRHDSTARSAFMPGLLLAVREVAARPGLTIGLERLLDV